MKMKLRAVGAIPFSIVPSLFFCFCPHRLFCFFFVFLCFLSYWDEGIKKMTMPVLSGGSSFSGHCSSSIFLWFLACSSIFFSSSSLPVSLRRNREKTWLPSVFVFSYMLPLSVLFLFFFLCIVSFALFYVLCFPCFFCVLPSSDSFSPSLLFPAVRDLFFSLFSRSLSLSSPLQFFLFFLPSDLLFLSPLVRIPSLDFIVGEWHAIPLVMKTQDRLLQE